MKRILVLLLFLISGCTFNNKKSYIERTMGINLKNCHIVEKKDTHSGFLGDGEYFAKLECRNLNLDKFKKLPLSCYLEEIINMKMCSSNKCESALEKYKIPKIMSGYYYFIDRHSDATNTYDESNLNNRSSYNFSLAIYDDINEIIYYYELDT